MVLSARIPCTKHRSSPFTELSPSRDPFGGGAFFGFLVVCHLGPSRPLEVTQAWTSVITSIQIASRPTPRPSTSTWRLLTDWSLSDFGRNSECMVSTRSDKTNIGLINGGWWTRALVESLRHQAPVRDVLKIYR